MKFSIRDLFLVTLIVAILVAWWVDRSFLKNKVSIQDDQIFRLRRQESNYQNGKTSLKTLPNSSAPAPIPPKVLTLRFPPDTDYQAPMEIYGERARR
jgi:hypothetical protein